MLEWLMKFLQQGLETGNPVSVEICAREGGIWKYHRLVSDNRLSYPYNRDNVSTKQDIFDICNSRYCQGTAAIFYYEQRPDIDSPNCAQIQETNGLWQVVFQHIVQ